MGFLHVYTVQTYKNDTAVIDRGPLAFYSQAKWSKNSTRTRVFEA
jgi:hypothetical protein